MAATTIVSTVVGVLVIGKWLNDLIGVEEFEFDPSQPGFGLITLPGGTVINSLSQVSVQKALAQSLRALVELDPEQAAQAWARYFVGRASVVGQIGAAGIGGAGYEPGKGFRFGDISLEGRLLNFSPIPPVIESGLSQGWAAIPLLFETSGVSAFPESPFAIDRREYERAFGRASEDVRGATSFEEMERLLGPNLARERLNPFLTDVGRERVAEARAAMPERFAGGSAEVRRFVAFNRDEMFTAAEKYVDAPIAYREYVGDLLFADRRYREFKGTDFADLETELAQDIDAFFETFSRAEQESFDLEERDLLVDRFQGELRQEIGEARYNLILEAVYAVREPDAPALFRDLQATKRDLAQSGYWELWDEGWRIWADSQRYPPAMPRTWQAARTVVAEERAGWHEGQGIDHIEARTRAWDEIGQIEEFRRFQDWFHEQYLGPWMVQNPDLAWWAWQFDYLSPRKAEEDFLSQNRQGAVLQEAR